VFHTKLKLTRNLKMAALLTFIAYVQFMNSVRHVRVRKWA